jgi:predicted ATPase
MILTSFKAKNFLSFKDMEISHLNEERTIIVGPNNSGKSNIIRVIKILGDYLSQRNLDLRPYYYQNKLDGGFEVEVGVKLSDEETDALTDFAMCSSFVKSLLQPPQGDLQEAINLKNRLVESSEPFFNNIFKCIVSVGVRRLNQQAFPADQYVKLQDGKEILYIHDYGRISNKIDMPTSSIVSNFPQLFFDFAKEKVVRPEELAEETKTLSQLGLDINNSFNWLYRKLSESKNTLTVRIEAFSGFEAEGLQYPFLMDALTRLQQFGQRRGYQSEQIEYAELLASIYNSSFFGVSDRRSYPRGTLFGETPLQRSSFKLLSGEELAILLFRLKNSQDMKDRQRYASIQEAFAILMAGKRLNVDLGMSTKTITQDIWKMLPTSVKSKNPFEQAPQLQGEMLSLQKEALEKKDIEPVIYVSTSDFAAAIENSAAGALEALILCVCIAGFENKVILLDEPALNLHPGMQRAIYKYIKEKKENHYIIVTHSPYMLGIDDLGSVIRMQMINGASEAFKCDISGLNGKEIEKMQKEVLLNPNLRASLFANAVVLVEGEGEEAAFPIWFEKCNFNVIDYNISLYSVSGEDSFPMYAKILKTWNIPFVIVHYKHAKKFDGLRNCKVLELPGKDLEEILKCYPDKFNQAETKYGKRRNHDPKIARYVATEVEPADAIKAICEEIKDYLKEYR